MIPGVAEWVRTLIVLALLATLMEWLLPVGDLKRYATLVAGLIILLALIGPVWGLVRGLARANATRWLGSSSPSHLGQLVRRQERQVVSAVVQSLPGVDSVAVTAHPGGVRVVIWGALVAPGVAAAARAAVEEVMQVPAGQVHVVVQPAPGHREGRAGNEAQLAH